MDRERGQSLLDAEPATQWLHSMYFVLTTMTTVGFGDITPQQDAEVTSSEGLIGFWTRLRVCLLFYIVVFCCCSFFYHG